MKEKSVTYILQEQTELVTLLSGLPEKYTLQKGEFSVATLSYMDTFDWRLYDKGFICLRQRRSVYVLTDFNGENIIEGEGPAQRNIFPLNFTTGVLGEKLQSVAGIRVLLPLAEIVRQSQSFQIVNRDQKVVLLGSFELNELVNSEGEPTFLSGSLRVQGVRGYVKILTRVVELLQSQGLEAGYSEERTLRLALASMGRKPLDYCSQFSIILDPAEAVIQAAQKIFLQLLDEMERNVPGIIQDIDTEFLHDFRVALRRTRSLLGSIKKMLPSADVDQFQRGLQEIGIATGPVRDLDVYLLGKKGYQAMLPEGLQEGLTVFFKELSRQRVQELRRMKKALQSRNCKQFLRRWRRYVEDSLIASAYAAGHEPCKEVAIKAIRKRLRSILKDGAGITSQSPDAALHGLRIQAKKLRYLLEFYRSLFPEAEMNSLVKSLKKLQDNLGSFNDLSVQQGMLGQHQKGLAGGEQKKAVQVAAALGGLITHLHEEQKGVRQEFEQRFKQFTTTDNRRFLICFFNEF
ncbi:MAG: CHAD domain-containing protein [Proteobacteria bacterium]|nr:CHAD domain-containing protein [Pseudomonadota bacterium]MBU1648087.1 CHAD domain-containing protein [Pseudomonadota bacterium]